MRKNWIAACMLMAYLLLLIKLLILKDLPMIRIGHLMLNFGGTQSGEGNLIPFKTILPYITGKMGLLIGGINVLGNIVLLIPIGFLLPFVFRSINTKMIFIISLVFCLLIESIQAILKIGIFDIDDVILNVLGFMMGYWSYSWLPSLWKYLKQNKIALAGFLITMVALIFLCLRFITSLQKPIDPGPMRAVMQNRDAIIDEKDLCGGTGGTGIMINLTPDHFTLKRKDGLEELIYFGRQTKIFTSKGEINKSDLKIGTSATIVTGPDADGKKIADAILICLKIQ